MKLDGLKNINLKYHIHNLLKKKDEKRVGMLIFFCSVFLLFLSSFGIYAYIYTKTTPYFSKGWDNNLKGFEKIRGIRFNVCIQFKNIFEAGGLMVKVFIALVITGWSIENWIEFITIFFFGDFKQKNLIGVIFMGVFNSFRV